MYNVFIYNTINNMDNTQMNNSVFTHWLRLCI